MVPNSVKYQRVTVSFKDNPDILTNVSFPKRRALNSMYLE